MYPATPAPPAEAGWHPGQAGNLPRQSRPQQPDLRIVHPIAGAQPAQVVVAQVQLELLAEREPTKTGFAISRPWFSGNIYTDVSAEIATDINKSLANMVKVLISHPIFDKTIRCSQDQTINCAISQTQRTYPCVELLRRELLPETG